MGIAVVAEGTLDVLVTGTIDLGTVDCMDGGAELDVEVGKTRVVFREVAGPGPLASWRSSWKKVLSFNGRARREEWWNFVILNSLATVPLTFLIRLIAGSDAGNTFESSVGVFLVLTAVGVTVRRMHDIGLRGIFAPLVFVPLLGLFLAFRNSDRGPNEYGQSPKYPDPRIHMGV